MVVLALSSEERTQVWESKEERVSSELELQGWDLEVFALLVLRVVSASVFVGQDTGDCGKEADSDNDLS